MGLKHLDRQLHTLPTGKSAYSYLVGTLRNSDGSAWASGMRNVLRRLTKPTTTYVVGQGASSLIFSIFIDWERTCACIDLIYIGLCSPLLLSLLKQKRIGLWIGEGKSLKLCYHKLEFCVHLPSVGFLWVWEPEKEAVPLTSQRGSHQHSTSHKAEYILKGETKGWPPSIKEVCVQLLAIKHQNIQHRLLSFLRQTTCDVRVEDSHHKFASTCWHATAISEGPILLSGNLSE